MNSILRSVRVFAGLTVLALIAGCGGTTPAPVLSVAVSPTTATLVAGATQTFTATVSNDGTTTPGVTWSASVGAITQAGVYTAPTPVGAASATITATSKTDATKTGTATVTLTPIVVTIPTTPTAIPGAGTEAITATVSGDATLNQGVTWSITSGGGTLTAVTTTSVTYNAPLPVTTASAVIKATSKTDPSMSASITIPLTPISVGAATPATVTLGVSQTQTFSATVSNDSSNSGVTWSISPSTPASGSIVAATGVYTAPTTVINASSTVTVTATSVKDPTKTGTVATITLTPIAVAAVTPATANLAGGATQQFGGAAVTYDGTSSGVTWSVSPSSGAGTISVGGLYTAPAVVGSTTSATITATSVKDPTKSGTVATVTLLPISVSFGSTTTATLDGGQQYGGVAATISNDPSNSGLMFTVASSGGDIGTNSTTSTTISGAGPFNPIYYSPASVPSATTTTITAASVKDPTRTATFTVTLNPAMAWTTPSSNSATLTAATTNTPYTYTLATSGGTGTKSYTVVSGALPGGLTLSTAGVISGTVTGAAGTYVATVRTTDQSSNPSILQGTFTIVVTAAPLVFNTPTLPTGTVGTAYSTTLTATGGTGALSYTVASGTLPAGLTLSAGGVLSGTPTAPTPAGPTGTSLTFKVTDSATPTPATQTTGTAALVVNPVTLSITSTALPSGFVSTAYSYQLTSTGGTGAITWSLSSGSLTGTGLTLSSGGLLSGTPTGPLSALPLTFQALDSAVNQQQTVTKALTLTISNALTITTGTTLPNATTNLTYSQTLAASGGSGTGYTWAVTSGATGTNSLASLNLSLSTAGVLTGTPTSAGLATFTVQVTDSASHTASATFTVNAYAPLALPNPNPSTLGAATVSSAYTGSVVSSGGVGPTYTWTVNSVALANTGTTVPLTSGLGLSVSSTGGGTLNITGTPTGTGTVTFTASVADSASHTAGPFTYTIAVTTTFTVSGVVSESNNCGTTVLPAAITLTLKQGTTTITTTTSSVSNGSYTLTGVPNGSYTVVPSITGPSSVFYPATQSITVSGGNITGTNFTGALGYSVSGTVTYTGAKTGTIYLSLNSSCNSGNNGNTQGTSISAKGAYTIQGVPPGTYTVSAFMDPLGAGVQNASDPSGTSGSTVLSTANLTAANVTLSDPGAISLSGTTPSLKGASGLATGAAVGFGTITNSSSVEIPSSYTLQWSTSSTFATVTGSQCFTAVGSNGTGIWLIHGLTNGSSLYFREQGNVGAGCTGLTSNFSSIIGPISITAPAGANTVSGSVTFPGTATGPMTVGLYDTNVGAIYATIVTNPVSAQAYSVNVPTGTAYFPFAVIDQNNDSQVDTGDLSNTKGNSQVTIAVSGNLANQNITLSNTNSTATVTTGHQHFTGSSDTYNLNFEIRGAVKLPVAAQITAASNPNMIIPMDLALCTNCGASFNFYNNINTAVPVVGDTYTIKVTYSDGTSENLTATVTAVLNAFATSLAPVTGGSTSTTPTFTWVDPANASSYTYSFYMNDSNGSTVWQVPGNNSNSNGLTSSTTSLTWGVDPTNGSNTPTPSILSTSTTYGWSIQTQDSAGNSATANVNYKP